MSPSSAPIVPGASLSAHFNASRLRSDTWNAAKNLAAQLVIAPDDEAAALELGEALRVLEPIESYWAFPGKEGFAHLLRSHRQRDWRRLSQMVQRCVRGLTSHSYRKRVLELRPGADDEEDESRDEGTAEQHDKPYFELLVVDSVSPREEEALRAGLLTMRREEDPFVYDVVVVPSVEDALIACLFNHVIQAVVVRYGLPLRSERGLGDLGGMVEGLDARGLERLSPAQRGAELGRMLRELRPELDLYLVTDESVEEAASVLARPFNRLFYRQEDYLELHLSVLRGVRSRYRTPFFKALRRHSEQPTGVFHALPISRGKSIVKSHWIQDMARFYGMNVFLAETSATSGGLDSLLDPQGPLKESQEAAARAFGAKRTYFVTNGTSTANKIVSQAVLRPGDIVLVDRNCHKSVHYSVVLSGAEVIYLKAYPLDDFSFYGAVPLAEITKQLEELKAAGKLERVRLLVLTNCTFDGIVYHPLRVMEECLKIKPNLIFHWDEAWFAFAGFSPTYRRRTAMDAARRLRERMKLKRRGEAPKDPLPDDARIRVYVTQSTHKTLTSLRQGSMIHVADQDFHEVEESYREAYMTHTSTSPNYQILASLDLGRRQAELEGFELVSKQVELALTLREQLAAHPMLRKWFRCLTPKDLIPAEHRASGIESYYHADRGWTPMVESWESDEFVLDPTRLTLHVGKTGVDGDTFKKRHLMERHGIQVNKTSRNTVLFMTNIGTTRSSVAHLIDALVKLADEFEQALEEESGAERRARERLVRSLTEELPPLPDFSAFHPAFRDGETPEGRMRESYFLGMDEENCDYVRIDDPALDAELASGREIVSAGFVTPYPPGFPILVPGELVEHDILTYMRALDTKEIHGYRGELGLRVFREGVLDKGES